MCIFKHMSVYLKIRWFCFNLNVKIATQYNKRVNVMLIIYTLSPKLKEMIINILKNGCVSCKKKCIFTLSILYCFFSSVNDHDCQEVDDVHYYNIKGIVYILFLRN